MTDDRMVLIELIEKGADGDLVRDLLAFAAERMMELEVEARTGAPAGQRRPGRSRPERGRVRLAEERRMTKSCDFAHVLGYGRAPQPAARQDPPVHADAALLALGGRLEKLWIAEQAAFARAEADDSDEANDLAEVACEASSAVVHQIEAASATTLAGLKVKARAFSWCRSDVLVTVEDLFGPDTSTDIRLLVGIVRDLLQLKGGAAPVMGTEAGLRQWEGET